MKYFVLAAAAVLAVGAVDPARAQSGPASFSATQTASSFTGSRAADAAAVHEDLSALQSEWDRADFEAPSKPSQYRVYGRDGYVTSGPGYNAMVLLMRSAETEVQEGRDRKAATDIAEAKSLLAASDIKDAAQARGSVESQDATTSAQRANG
jgi:hypothetical protein